MAYELALDQNVDTTWRGEATYFSYTIHVDLPDQFLAGMVATKIVDAHIQELENAGSSLLRLKLWEDKQSGTWTTDFKVEVWAAGYAPDADTGVQQIADGRIGQIPWPIAIPLIIEAVIALIIVVGVVWTIIEVKHIVTYLGPVGSTIAIVAVAAIVLGITVMIVSRK